MADLERPHYTTVGHVTIDVLEDGSRRPGGGAFYSALQAARLGARARVVTCGVVSEIEALLEPFAEELELQISPAPETTTLSTSGAGVSRKQRVLAWAGPLPNDLELGGGILHLAPVARELPLRWNGRARFLGLTPQGLVRRWSGSGGEISLAPLAGAGRDESSSTGPQAGEAGTGTAALLALAARCTAIVASEDEQPWCADLMASGSAGGAVVAVTAGPRPSTITCPDGTVIEVEVPPVGDAVDDLGAGDVFSAAFFLALAEGRSAEGAAAFANAAAAVRMLGSGAGAIGRREAIESRLQVGARLRG
jgi:1D-myo-inositol 3-kinase